MKPYSDCVERDKFIFVPGKTGFVGDALSEGSFEEECAQALANLDDVIVRLDLARNAVVSVEVYLASMDDYEAINGVYVSYFQDHRAARTCVAVAGLPRRARVAVRAVACR